VRVPALIHEYNIVFELYGTWLPPGLEIQLEDDTKQNGFYWFRLTPTANYFNFEQHPSYSQCGL